MSEEPVNPVPPINPGPRPISDMAPAAPPAQLPSSSEPAVFNVPVTMQPAAPAEPVAVTPTSTPAPTSIPVTAVDEASPTPTPTPNPMPVATEQPSAGQLPKKSKKKLIMIIAGVAVLILAIGIFFLLSGSKSDNKTASTAAKTAIPPDPAQVQVIKTYTANWQSNAATSQALLDLVALKKDPGCKTGPGCTDAEIVASQKKIYGVTPPIISSYKSDGNVVTIELNTSTGAKASYAFTLTPSGDSFKIASIKTITQ